MDVPWTAYDHWAACESNSLTCHSTLANDRAISGVPSADPESTTTTRDAQASDASVGPILGSSLKVRITGVIFIVPFYGRQREFCSRCVGKFIRFDRQVAILTSDS